MPDRLSGKINLRRLILLFAAATALITLINSFYAAYRVQNIGEAARRMNGTLLMPGDTFSLNDTIKERTEKNGYTVGFVVGAGGVFAEDLGGLGEGAELLVAEAHGVVV